MKLSIISFLFLFSLAIFSDNSFAQRTVDVTPGFGQIGNVIGGDTTATGERVDSNTVYILERGGLYILDGTFSPRYKCIIKAAEGDGARPKIILGVPTGGSTPSQAIRPRANFSISGCYISAQDELGGMGSRIIRFEENGIKIVIDDCVLDIASQAAFRFNTDNNSLFITNSIISNIGTMASPQNGRAFDDRGNDIDTLFVENCTLYNLTFRVLRDGGGGIINYAHFNHNTIVNIGFGAIDLGPVLHAYVANNMIINGDFLGSDVGSSAVGDYILAMSEWVDSLVTPTIVIRNNNIYNDPALVDALPDSVGDPVTYDSLTNYYVTQGGFESTNLDEMVSFTDGPESPISQVTTYFQDPGSAEGFLDTAGQANFDFSYATSLQSYTGGTGGQPIGALSWFGMTVGVNENTVSGVPDKFQLNQNYPNPFNPSTKITYNLPSNSVVRLKVYDVLGKKVADLVNKEQPAGFYEVNFDASNLSSGVYFYRLETGSFVKTKKMLLMK